jgi:hypothetical protein
MTYTLKVDERFKRYENIVVDIERLRKESHLLLWQEDYNRYTDQLSLQTDGSADWSIGIGSKPEVEESIWDKLHPDLVGTWWEEFFASLPFKLYRARLLTLQPRTCYSIHTDRTPRIHIAIDTTPQARFLFTKPSAVRFIPADGHVWWIDTTHEHSAMNGSLKPRIHFVACLDNTDPY